MGFGHQGFKMLFLKNIYMFINNIYSHETLIYQRYEAFIQDVMDCTPSDANEGLLSCSQHVNSNKSLSEVNESRQCFPPRRIRVHVDP